MFTSIFDSLEYESRKSLKKYTKSLKRVNQFVEQYRQMDDDELKQVSMRYRESFDIHNPQDVVHVYAITREVTYRLLGKFQYDVQMIGAFAAIDRNMIQMLTNL